MSDFDKVMLISMFVTIAYFLITEHLICKIERLKKENKLLEEDNFNLQSKIFFIEDKESE